MHLQTHLLSGWCFGNLLPLRPRERVLCMVAATAPDLDGLGIVFGREAYWDYHHTLGHCAIFGIAMAAALAAFSARPVRLFIIVLLLFHLHLLMDLFGSGPGWTIQYLWPMSRQGWKTACAWDFYSWQNLSAAGILLAWAVLIALFQQRTPLEVLMPSLDRRLVAALRRFRERLRRRPGIHQEQV